MITASGHSPVTRQWVLGTVGRARCYFSYFSSGVTVNLAWPASAVLTDATPSGADTH